MLRLFVAIDIPEPIAHEVERLNHGLPHVRWTPPDQLHLTLKFLGDVSEHNLENLRDHLANVELTEFELSLYGVGQFGRRGMQPVLWVGVDNPEPLQKLQTEIDRALVPLEFPKEKRKFTPHITIARIKQIHHERMENYMKQFSEFQSSRFLVDTFQLYSSKLKPEGAVHNIEESYNLLEPEHG